MIDYATDPICIRAWLERDGDRSYPRMDVNPHVCGNLNTLLGKSGQTPKKNGQPRVTYMLKSNRVDADDRDIWEGDIVSIDDPWAQPHISTVIRDGAAFYVSGEYVATGGDMPLNEFAGKCHVIGNIFETPEKLKTTTR